MSAYRRLFCMDMKISKYGSLFSFIAICVGFSESEDYLFNVANEAYEKALSAPLSRQVEVFRESLENLSDQEKIRAIAEWLFVRDETDGRMRIEPGAYGGYFLRKDPSLIEDLSELRRMLAEEENIRRYYVLVGMSSPYMYTRKEDFIPLYARMFYRDDLMAKTSGDYYRHSLTNASYFTYEIIMRNLEVLEAEFQAPDEKLSYEKRIPILIRWLKENWPGCEDLRIPGEVENPREMKHPGVTTPMELPRNGNDASASSTFPGDSGMPSWMWTGLVTLGAAFAGVLAWKAATK